MGVSAATRVPICSEPLQIHHAPWNMLMPFSIDQTPSPVTSSTERLGNAFVFWFFPSLALLQLTICSTA